MVCSGGAGEAKAIGADILKSQKLGAEAAMVLIPKQFQNEDGALRFILSVIENSRSGYRITERSEPGGSVTQIDTFILTVTHDEPYLGALGPGETRTSEAISFVRAIRRYIQFSIARLLFELLRILVKRVGRDLRNRGPKGDDCDHRRSAGGLRSRS